MARPTVFLVDDDESVRRGLRRLLLALGYQVVVFASAEDFLELRAIGRPSCAIVDVRMPGMTGLDLQDVLRSTGRRVPVIVISGHADAATAERATEAGAVAFLSKPFDDAALADALRIAIDRDLASNVQP